MEYLARSVVLNVAEHVKRQKAIDPVCLSLSVSHSAEFFSHNKHQQQPQKPSAKQGWTSEYICKTLHVEQACLLPSRKTDRSHSSCNLQFQQDILLLLLVYNNKLNKQGEVVGHELFSNWPMLPTRRRKEEQPSTW